MIDQKLIRLSARLRKANLNMISGSDRLKFLNEVWEMYQTSYRSIGLTIPSSKGLLKYSVWELHFDRDLPIAFSLYTETKFGLKCGLIGHCGTSEGKREALKFIRTAYKRNGYYGEASHKVLDIALAAGAPVVCSSLASSVLGKPVEVVGDLSYRRSLPNVGVVEKMLVGRPKGVPVTSFKNPVCPITASEIDPVFLSDVDTTEEDCHSHYSCVMSNSLSD